MILFKPNPKIPILNKLPVKPVAAYDINQRLIKSYRSAAFNVRRSLDNSTLDIPFLSNGRIDENAIMSHVGSQNLFPNSEEFGEAVWSKNLSSITANIAANPLDGAMTADKLVENTVNGEHTVTRAQSVIAGKTYTISVYAKAVERTFFTFGFTATGFAGASRFSFNLLNGTAGSAPSGTFQIQSLSNGWYRVSVTNTATSNATSLAIMQPAGSYLGDGTSGLLVWGAQFNEGTLQPYTQTSTTTKDGFGYATTLYDEIGSNHLTQITANLQPTIVENGILNKDTNGNVYLNFNSQRMEATLGIGTASSIVAVYSKNTNAVNTHVFGSGKSGGNNGINIIEDSSNRTNITFNGNTNYASTDTGLIKKIIVGDDTPATYYKDGVENTLGTSVVTTNEANTLAIGTTANQAQIKFYSGMVFEDKLSAMDRRNLERLLGKQNKIDVV